MIANEMNPMSKCPVCKGEGMTHHNVTRNEWGVWESDERECYVCHGEGEVTLWVLDEWTEWWAEQDAC